MSVPRLLAGVRDGRPLWLEGHRALHGACPAPGPELIEAVASAGLRGRGGASYPTAAKLAAVARRRGPRSLLVNGAEGEPMSAKDGILLELAPHLVLDGAFAAADAVGASAIVIAIRENARRALGSIDHALAERGRPARVRVAHVPVSYLAGEESALIRHLDGGPLLPRVVPPRPHERGLGRRPTLVQNPETLANVGLIARHGAAWFREVGTQDHPGSVLVTFSGAVMRPGVQEVACGTHLESALQRAGGAVADVRAVLIGGYHGTWIAREQIGAVTLDDGGLARHDATVAAGVVVALGHGACPVQEIARTASWLAGQSARQCGPCSNGLPAIAAMLTSIADGRAPRDAMDRVLRWSSQVRGRGACRLPDGAVRFVESGMRVFADEVAEHARRGPCPGCRRPPTLRAPAAHSEVAA